MSKERPSLRQKIEKRKKDEKKAKIVNFSDFKTDVKRNPMIFIGLGGSAFLTALMGVFIGLAPELDTQGRLVLFGGVEGWGSAAIGIFFGILYALAFPVLGEFGAYYWHRKASLRDVGSKAQGFIAYTTMLIAAAFTVTSAIAASVILASLLHTFDAFQAIPDWAQKWTVLIIPVALAMHAGANIWYDHVSQYAEERREMERDLQTVQIEAENRIRQARVDAQERAAIAMAERYEQISSEEARLAGEKLAENAWKNDRTKMGGDDDGDGVVNLVDSRDNGRKRVPIPAMNSDTKQSFPTPPPED